MAARFSSWTVGRPDHCSCSPAAPDTSGRSVLTCSPARSPGSATTSRRTADSFYRHLNWICCCRSPRLVYWTAAGWEGCIWSLWTGWRPVGWRRTEIARWTGDHYCSPHYSNSNRLNAAHLQAKVGYFYSGLWADERRAGISFESFTLKCLKFKFYNSKPQNF